MPGSRKGDEGVLINIYRGGFQLVFHGIHMAGPNLNNQTFAQGLYAMPRTGGTPASPLVFFTRQYPTGIKDFSEVWWDAQPGRPRRALPQRRRARWSAPTAAAGTRWASGRAAARAGPTASPSPPSRA